MDDRQRLINSSLGELEHYLLCWDQPGHQECGPSPEEAAYHVLEHTGKLVRYTGSTACVTALQALPPAQRKALLLAACRYARNQRLSQRCRSLLEPDILEPDALERLDAIVLGRDALGIVLDLASTLASDLEDDLEVPVALGEALTYCDQLTDLLYRRPDVLSLAWRILAQEPGGVPAWLRRAAEMDREYQQEDVGAWFRSAEPRVIRFQPKRTVALAAADETDESIQLEAEDDIRLLIFQHPIPGSRGVQLVGVRHASAAKLLVDGREVAWAQVPDAEGYGVVAESDISAAWQGPANVEVILHAER
jgi:hypothetical protein